MQFALKIYGLHTWINKLKNIVFKNKNETRNEMQCICKITHTETRKSFTDKQTSTKRILMYWMNDWLIDWLIYWIVFYAVSAIFQPNDSGQNEYYKTIVTKQNNWSHDIDSFTGIWIWHQFTIKKILSKTKSCFRPGSKFYQFFSWKRYKAVMKLYPIMTKMFTSMHFNGQLSIGFLIAIYFFASVV